ncbi:hypothetical protein LLB_2408 [Legionella longbeachae D-4968]|nr:hypothetical protein LLB_2408 [Legionella longbeachae D-4968]
MIFFAKHAGHQDPLRIYAQYQVSVAQLFDASSLCSLLKSPFK